MSSEFINKHATRVLANNGTNMDLAWISSIDSWITSQGLLPYLIDWTSAAGGLIKNGSNQVSRAFGLGATWLPRLGDLAPNSLTTCTYNATGISGVPGIVLGTNAFMYYGTARGGTIRLENIRRIHHQGFTAVVVYKETHGAGQSLLAYGQDRLNLKSTTTGITARVGTPSLGFGTGRSDTKTATLTSNLTHIAGITFDQDKITAWANGVAGSGNSGYIAAVSDSVYSQYRPLLGGAKGPGQQGNYQLGIGSFNGGFLNDTPVTSCVRTVTSDGGGGGFTFGEIIIFSTSLTSTQMTSLDTFLRGRYP